MASAAAPLPFLGDDIFVLIAAELDARMLGRLGCAAQRFWRVSVPSTQPCDDVHAGARAVGLKPAPTTPTLRSPEKRRVKVA